jgi:hypothetical protein
MTKQLATWNALQANYDAGHFVHPRGTTTAIVNFVVERKLGRAGKPLTVVIKLSDQKGRWRSLKFKKLPST